MIGLVVPDSGTYGTKHDPNTGELMIDAPYEKWGVLCVRAEGGLTITNIPRRLVDHSPTGYEWGYGGSGPADFALNALDVAIAAAGMKLSGETSKVWNKALCAVEVYRLHQDFKWDFIARMPKRGGTIERARVEAWITAHWDKVLHYVSPEDIDFDA